MIIAIISFIIVLAVLVLVHEWGHFIVARRAGLKVEEFGFGFPPRIFKFKKGQTTYSLNLIPLGGFVKIFGEDGSDKNNPESFASRKPGQRARIVVAGVVMNFLLALILIIVGFNVGLPSAIDESSHASARNIKIQISLVNPESPASNAGIKIGDEIYGVDNISITEISQLQDYIKSHLAKELTLKVKRGMSPFEFKLKPRTNPPANEGPLGVALVKTGIVRFPWYQSIWLGIKATFILLWAIILGFGGFIRDLFTTGHISRDLSGPVGIAVLTGQAVDLGFSYVLQLTALISLNLAILNLVPFPALDGGKLLFLGIEKLKGSPVSPVIENFIHMVGLALLLTLAIFITFQDILKLR